MFPGFRLIGIPIGRAKDLRQMFSLGSPTDHDGIIRQFQRLAAMPAGRKASRPAAARQRDDDERRRKVREMGEHARYQSALANLERQRARMARA